VGNDVVVVLILILVIVLVWRGPKTLPEIGRMCGRGIREARAEAAKLRSDDEDAGTTSGSGTGSTPA
jgi:Sec-independent protein translocase protein TatA